MSNVVGSVANDEEQILQELIEINAQITRRLVGTTVPLYCGIRDLTNEEWQVIKLAIESFGFPCLICANNHHGFSFLVFSKPNIGGCTEILRIRQNQFPFVWTKKFKNIYGSAEEKRTNSWQKTLDLLIKMTESTKNKRFLSRYGLESENRKAVEYEY